MKVRAAEQGLAKDDFDIVSVYTMKEVLTFLRQLKGNHTITLQSEVPVKKPGSQTDYEWKKAMVTIQGADGSEIHVSVEPGQGESFTEADVDPNFVGTMKVRPTDESFHKAKNCILEVLARGKYDYVPQVADEE